MKVLQVVTDRDRRGAQVFATDLERGLRHLGLEVSTVALEPGAHPILDVPSLGQGGLTPRSLLRLRALIRQADIVIAHGARTLPATAVAGIGCRAPVIYRQISDPRFWAGSWARRLRVAAYLRRIERVVALADDVAEIVCHHYWLDSAKVNVIPNAVPSEKFWVATLEETRLARENLLLDPDEHVLGFVGALVPEKGCDLAIHVARMTHCTLLVAGAGPELAALQTEANSSKDARIIFLGVVDDPRHVYHASDIIVFPSRGGDSMPATLIEAALCGRTAVATTVGSISSIIQDGVTGRLVKPGDVGEMAQAVERLLANHPMRDRLSQSAAEFAELNFTIEATASRWLRVLELAIERSDLCQHEPVISE